jgi:DNA end-binding protein Ku
MARRPFWTGYLKLSLVTCPVAMTPAHTTSEKVRFHTLNRTTGDRVLSRYVDAKTGKVVREDNLVKGYQRGDDDYVALEDEELEAVALETIRTIEIEKFVQKDLIEWIWYDRPHYLTPREKIGEEAFSVIRDSMAATKTVGVSRLVLYRRERAVMLQPRGRGIILWTLRFGDEVRDEKLYLGDMKSEKVDPKLLGLVSKLIEERTASWSDSMLADPVQMNLKRIIAAKEKGSKPANAKPHAPEKPTNVIDIMDALKRSLAGGRPKGRQR